MKIGAACFMHHLPKLHSRKCSMASKNAGKFKNEWKFCATLKFHKENIQTKKQPSTRCKDTVKSNKMSSCYCSKMQKMLLKIYKFSHKFILF